jgi:eukaryotic-like serine/threonine-protein kinase
MSNKLGRFEILGEITHSEIGSVYKALDPESGQLIALKTVRLQMLGEQAQEFVERVLEEIEIAKVLGSHNLAAVFGAEEIDGQFCAAMEYIQGNSIATMLARKEGFSIWDLLDIARQSCQGLTHAHSHNIFHYSLEPAKIMVTWDGTVKLLSFGISSMGAFTCTAEGQPVDVVHYMSPEQMRGEEMDGRSNLFSLGAIFYEMVTERKAFTGEDADRVRQQVLEHMPTPPDQINRKLHPALSEVIMKALAKAPEARYQSGPELVNDLERCKESTTKLAKSTARGAASGDKPAASAGAPPAAPPETVVKSPANAKAAAAAAGWEGVGGSSLVAKATSPAAASIASPAAGFSQPPSLTQSAASAVEEMETAAPGFRSDPMMDESKAANPEPSFSDVAELPPLKQVQVALPPELLPEPEIQQYEITSPARAQSPKPRVQPGQVARKAVTEIKKTPPRLVGYSVIAATGVILLVIAVMAWHIHSENSDEESAAGRPVAASKTADTGKVAAPTAAQNATPTPLALQAVQPEQVTAEPAKVSVTPKYNRRKLKAQAPLVAVAVPGQLTINSSPEGAQVQVDGRSDPGWVTPFNMTGLVPGQHTVNISKSGFSAETRNIEVASNSKSFLVVQLAAQGATISVASQPSGAAVFLDGKDTGRSSPAQFSVDKPGSHTVLLKKSGYLEETVTANLQPGQVFHFAPTLKALGSTDDIKIGSGKFKKLFGGGDISGMGAVSVKTQPKGAQVAVNNRIVDKFSPVEFHLNPGTYVVDITMSGYKSIHRVIEVEKGGKIAIDEALEHQ